MDSKSYLGLTKLELDMSCCVMLRLDFEPVFEIYDSLITGLLQKGEPLLAHLTLEKMLKNSHLPQTSSVHSILVELLKKSCAREASSLVTLMLGKRIRLNIILSTETVKLLFSRRMQDKAFQVLVLLYDNGYMVDMEDLVYFFCQSKMLLEACKMMQFSLEKHQTVDIGMCCTVIEGLCNNRRLSEAFGLYYELVERGKHQQLRCLENLKMALEAGGRLDALYQRECRISCRLTKLQNSAPGCQNFGSNDSVGTFL